MPTHYTVAIAGSTEHTRQCAESLFDSDQFTVSHILTPIPKPIGRKQIVTKNPLHQWAEDHGLATTLIETKITEATRQALTTAERPDLLLVVDFGYIVPSWLLEWPTTAPLNIHPSRLPRWRGSSPGQFVLLYGEKDSAVTLMVMDAQLDHGPIIAQLPISVVPGWTQTEYYGEAFQKICAQLPELVSTFAAAPEKIQPQPDSSPTPVAGRLSKEDSFIPWTAVEAAMAGENITATTLSPILQAAYQHHHSVATVIVHAAAAFHPWPSLWTLVPTTKGEKRMKILTAQQTGPVLTLQTVQVEGKNPTTWNEIKSLL